MGGTRIHHKAKMKLKIIAFAARHSLKKAAAVFKVDTSCISRWLKAKECLLVVKERQKSTKHRGKMPVFTNIEEQLLDFFGERRAHDMPVSYAMLIAYACSLERSFRALSSSARKAYMYRFTK
jgi:hypothetical protein